MSLSQKEINNIATILLKAEKECEPLDSISDRYPEMTWEDAYAIQLKTIEMKTSEGARVVGRKIGQTSRAMQELVGIYEPDFGTILDNKVYMEGEVIPAETMIIPRIEVEIGFYLKQDLKGPGVNVLDVLAATEGVFPLLEVKDSRVKDPHDTTVEESIADNATSGIVILGGKLTRLDNNIDLRLIGMNFEHNGKIVGTGTGVECMSNPAHPVAWLANKLAKFDMKLKKGEFIMSGALTKAIEVEPGDYFKATFDHLGSVSARFK